MKIAGQLMLPDDGGAVRLTPGWLRVEDGGITHVGEGDIPGDADLGGEGFIVCPGFIDAHMHLPQFGIVGAHGLGLLDWLGQVTFPAELRWAETDTARRDTRSAIRRMLGAGTTGFAAYATVHADAARAALDEAQRAGVRAHVGQVLMDRGAPEALCRPTNQLLEEAAALQAGFPAGGRVSAAVTPRFAPSCSAALLEGAGALARATSALVQTHIAETRAECVLVGELFDGQRYLDVYRSAGLLGPRTVLGHGIYLEATDLAVLSELGGTVAHCPLANSFLMSGRLDASAVRASGAGLALGSDIGAGYEVSMVRVARAMLETAGALRISDAGRGPETVPTAAEAWWRITAGNARALGWPDAGRLAVGVPADVVLIQPDRDTLRTLFTGHTPPVDPLAGLLFGWDDRWVDQVLLRGRPAGPIPAE